MSQGAPSDRPADMLAGMTTPEGWFIEGVIKPTPGATGGHFSSSYFASKDGRRAFLKALDYAAAIQAPDPAAALKHLTTAFLFERDLMERARGMKNVVRVLDGGEVNVEAAGPLGRVSYLVFELAEGDIRRYRALSGAIEVAWALRTVYHAAMGLRQLHGLGIAHQDVKPSNLLLFENGSLGKLGDLGRACVAGGTGPYEDHFVAGDVSYAPPEIFYGYRSTDWAVLRKACDLFHLGSLLLFQLTGVNASGAIFTVLDRAYWPAESGGGWTGSFDDVVIHLREAVSQVSTEFPSIPDELLDQQIRSRFRELCEPDPRRRGHPKDHARRYGDPYSLERYISHFHAMAARAERLLGKIVVP